MDQHVKFQRDWFELSSPATPMEYFTLIHSSDPNQLPWEVLRGFWCYFRHNNLESHAKYGPVPEHSREFTRLDNEALQYYEAQPFEDIFLKFMRLDTDSRKGSPLILCFIFESGDELHIKRMSTGDNTPGYNHLCLWYPMSKYIGWKNRSVTAKLRARENIAGQMITAMFHLPNGDPLTL